MLLNYEIFWTYFSVVVFGLLGAVAPYSLYFDGDYML